MPATKKTVMTEAYKDALSKKEEEAFAKKARGMAVEYHKDQKVHEARKNSVLWKRQQKIKGMKQQLKELETRQKKAQAAVEANTYFMVGVALMIFAAVDLVLLLMFLGSGHKTAAVVALILMFLLLFSSVSIQAKGLEFEKIARETKILADDLRQQIKKIENPSLR
ncbi:hypothetical protein IJH16_01200 [Candidatus Saccharibacteria bacterium]|nr:hypothetical protein [Candidatus Saccharibacteria bacterium]